MARNRKVAVSYRGYGVYRATVKEDGAKVGQYDVMHSGPQTWTVSVTRAREALDAFNTKNDALDFISELHEERQGAL